MRSRASYTQGDYMRFLRCDGVDRRELLHVGGLTALGLSVSDWISHRSAHAAAGQALPVRAQSCILIWLDGGPSHLDTFDLKPNAPSEVRGPFSPIATRVPGVQISEQLARTADVMSHVAVIRSMTSPLGEHNFASHYLLTGYQPNRALVYPSLPAVLSHFQSGDTSGRAAAGNRVVPRNTRALPSNIAIARPNDMLGAGYLPDSTLPFVIDGDPSRPDFKVRDLSPAAGLKEPRLTRRQTFRNAVDQFSRKMEIGRERLGEQDSSFDQAFRLVQSPQARDAFDLEREHDATRNRYGRHAIGHGCLMARRLVEAGAKFVTVTDRGWDTHEDIYLRLKEGFTGGSAGKVPKLDQAYSALIADLADRGLLDTTLVILMGEFGRTPKLNLRGGRDHWPGAFSVALAGGGIAGGRVVGQSDTHGERPAERPVSPADLSRTLYHLVGIDGDKELTTPDGRPIQINRDGALIEEVLS